MTPESVRSKTTLFDSALSFGIPLAIGAALAWAVQEMRLHSLEERAITDIVSERERIGASFAKVLKPLMGTPCDVKAAEIALIENARSANVDVLDQWLSRP